MSREVRRVSATWRHPRRLGEPIPLLASEMPEWIDTERTHWQLYETTTEGTPISPPMPTPEALARWLADTGASAFGDMTATYDQWLSTIKRGSAISAVAHNGRLISGVEAEDAMEREEKPS